MYNTNKIHLRVEMPAGQTLNNKIRNRFYKALPVEDVDKAGLLPSVPVQELPPGFISTVCFLFAVSGRQVGRVGLFSLKL